MDKDFYANQRIMHCILPCYQVTRRLDNLKNLGHEKLLLQKINQQYLLSNNLYYLYSCNKVKRFSGFRFYGTGFSKVLIFITLKLYAMNRGNLLRYGVKVLLLIRQTYTDVNKYFMWTSKLPVINQFQFEAATIPKSTIKNNQDYRTMAVDSSRTCLTKSCDFYPSI